MTCQDEELTLRDDDTSVDWSGCQPKTSAIPSINSTVPYPNIADLNIKMEFG
jgi:hypothetical protein